MTPSVTENHSQAGLLHQTSSCSYAQIATPDDSNIRSKLALELLVMASAAKSLTSNKNGGNGTKGEKGAKGENTGEPSDHERQQESSKAAKSSLAASEKAKELTQAAAGAGDPDERQRLLNEALQKEMEAESFGKTGRWLTSGSFQGLLAGGGMGTGAGMSLGTLTGVLVGGVTSLATGGLGGAVGAGVGALHGPFVKMGDVAGEGIRKVTGDLPGWEATEEQQGKLEKMVGEIHDQERPSEKDLKSMADGAASMTGTDNSKEGANGSGRYQGRSWTDTAASYAPSKDSLSSLGGSKSTKSNAQKSSAESVTSDTSKATSDRPTQSNSSSKATGSAKQSDGTATASNRGRPRKLEKGEKDGSSKPSADEQKKKPRKLEVRS